MLPPLIRRPRRNVGACSKQRGFTMALVAITMVVIISMAALSIDIGYAIRSQGRSPARCGCSGIGGSKSNLDFGNHGGHKWRNGRKLGRCLWREESS